MFTQAIGRVHFNQHNKPAWAYTEGEVVHCSACYALERFPVPRLLDLKLPESSFPYWFPKRKLLFYHCVEFPVKNFAIILGYMYGGFGNS